MRKPGRQQDVMEFVVAYRAEKGYSPSLREIVKGVGLRSTSAARYHLDRLKSKGKITWTPRVPRSIVPMD